MDGILSEILDQALHFLWAVLFLAPFIVGAIRNKITVMTFVISALLMALPREFVDQCPCDNIGMGKMLDLAFFAIGGYFAGLWYMKITKCKED